MPEEVEMRDLLAAVGEVLLRWGFLEHEMEKWLVGPETSILSRWRDTVRRSDDVDGTGANLLADVKEVASVRNLLAHGLWSASVDTRNGEEAKVVCRATDGHKHTITLSKLQEMERRLHALKVRVGQLRR